MAEGEMTPAQIAIYRRMPPSERLALGMAMIRQMRTLMDSALKASHPHWTAEDRRREIARRTLHARG